MHAIVCTILVRYGPASWTIALTKLCHIDITRLQRTLQTSWWHCFKTLSLLTLHKPDRRIIGIGFLDRPYNRFYMQKNILYILYTKEHLRTCWFRLMRKPSQAQPSLNNDIWFVCHVLFEPNPSIQDVLFLLWCVTACFCAWSGPKCPSWHFGLKALIGLQKESSAKWSCESDGHFASNGFLSTPLKSIVSWSSYTIFRTKWQQNFALTNMCLILPP